MVLNNSCRKNDISLPYSLVSWFRLSRERPATTSPLSFLSSPSLSFSPFIHFTHLQPDGLLTEKEYQAKFSQQRRPPCRVPRLLKAWCLDTRLRVYANRIRSQVQQGERQRRRAYRRRPTELETQEKRQRRKHAPHGQQFRRAQLPECRFPAKFGYQPIKLEIYLLAHTYTAKYVRVQLRHLGVYKES